MADNKVIAVLTVLGLLNHSPQGKNAKIPCPFHSAQKMEQPLSMEIESGRWNCFFPGCGMKGTSLETFVQRLHGVNIIEAATFIRDVMHEKVTRDSYAALHAEWTSPVALSMPASKPRSTKSSPSKKKLTGRGGGTAQSSATKPSKPSFSLSDLRPANIPHSLQATPQWVVWRYEFDEQRRDWVKAPYNPKTTRAKARPNDPTTSADFFTALQRAAALNVDGIGFMFSDLSPFAGVDLDDCRDPDTGQIDSWAQRIISSLNSYTEVSPSGTGVKIFVRGQLPPGLRRFEQRVEMYDSKRYFTVTGHHLPGTPITIEDRQVEIEALHNRLTERGI